MQAKHTEVARLTFAKNVQRCLSIHGGLDSLNDGGESGEELQDGAALVHCITHNTDKIDRRFFGYYSN